MIYVCVEHEGKFGIHLYVCKEIIPHFFAAGHCNYVRDSIVNLRRSVSVLLFSHFKKINWFSTKLYIDVFTDANKLISINKSIVSSHHNVTPSLITLHALSGYNFVTMMFGIGKSKTLRAISKIPLRYVGDVDAKFGGCNARSENICSQMLWTKSMEFI